MFSQNRQHPGKEHPTPKEASVPSTHSLYFIPSLLLLLLPTRDPYPEITPLTQFVGKRRVFLTNLRAEGAAERLTKVLVCAYALPMDTDNRAVKAWVGQELGGRGQWEGKSRISVILSTINIFLNK